MISIPLKEAEGDLSVSHETSHSSFSLAADSIPEKERVNTECHAHGKNATDNEKEVSIVFYPNLG